ncbi:MAG: molybdopterin-guanine dinucleotide biosynthesis protein B [Gemmatimonadales bacterium]
MAATRIISIIGKKGAGKTTLAVALSAEFVRRRHRVMSMKHASHPATVDTPGTDTYRHFHEGKAERVLIASPTTRGLFERVRDDTDPITLAKEYLDGADLVIAEGFTDYPLPKIEVFRREVSDTPHYDRSSDSAANWIAIVCDDDTFRADCTVLRFRDTMWLQLLANLAWDGAKVIGP